jgi:hypothetical protein
MLKFPCPRSSGSHSKEPPKCLRRPPRSFAVRSGAFHYQPFQPSKSPPKRRDSWRPAALRTRCRKRLSRRPSCWSLRPGAERTADPAALLLERKSDCTPSARAITRQTKGRAKSWSSDCDAQRLFSCGTSLWTECKQGRSAAMLIERISVAQRADCYITNAAPAHVERSFDQPAAFGCSSAEPQARGAATKSVTSRVRAAATAKPSFLAEIRVERHVSTRLSGQSVCQVTQDRKHMHASGRCASAFLFDLRPGVSELDGPVPHAGFAAVHAEIA